jgi:predicted acyltransferase (DUF342 family)
MIRCLTLIALTVLGTAAGCVNASDDTGSGSGDTRVNANSTATRSVNGSIHVPANKQNGNVSTVNGSIRVDDDATLQDAQTVNGDIRIGAHATAVSLGTVNGSITLGSGAHVSKGVKAVNGSVTLHDDSQVAGPITSVNGKIVLTTAHVGGGITTVNSDVNIGSNSRVEGGILVKKQTSGLFHRNVGERRIVIGPGAVVQGNLMFEHTVQLYVSDRATIGSVSGATPIKFSGDNPPS